MASPRPSAHSESGSQTVPTCSPRAISNSHQARSSMSPRLVRRPPRITAMAKAMNKTMASHSMYHDGNTGCQVRRRRRIGGVRSG